MELTNELKAKFFALYWEQEVLYYGASMQVVCEISFPKYFEITDYHLTLKPLSSITDEDAIEVAKISNIPNEWAFYKKAYQSGYYCTDMITLDVADYLRSKGYILPFMNISVEEMIEAGWVKLIEL
jgi:hypothetical protein